MALTLALFALGINFFPAYQLHYAAACTCLMILAAVTGLQKLAAVRREAARIVLFLCAAHFLFWYSMHLFENTPIARAALPFETWDAINHQNPAAADLRESRTGEDTGRLTGVCPLPIPAASFSR